MDFPNTKVLGVDFAFASFLAVFFCSKSKCKIFFRMHKSLQGLARAARLLSLSLFLIETDLSSVTKVTASTVNGWGSERKDAPRRHCESHIYSSDFKSPALMFFCTDKVGIRPDTGETWLHNFERRQTFPCSSRALLFQKIHDYCVWETYPAHLMTFQLHSERWRSIYRTCWCH